MSKISIIIPVYWNSDTLMALYEDMKEIIYSNLYSRRPLIKSIANLIIKAPQLESVISYNYDNLVEQWELWGETVENLIEVENGFNP